MRAFGAGTKRWLLNSALLFGSTFLAANVQAGQPEMHLDDATKSNSSLQVHQVSARLTSSTARISNRRATTRSFGISCVPYAREVSGIRVVGNAWQWWKNANGVYARGDQPEAGSVLNFRSNGRMPLGHVAVVRQIVNAREVIVDHANWPIDGRPGAISQNIAVVDVSEANNWSAVRVELGRSSNFGSVYPTYGFIYKRPDTGIVTASVAPPAPIPPINPVPSDLRPMAERPWRTMEEVAESRATAPASGKMQAIPVADTR